MASTCIITLAFSSFPKKHITQKNSSFEKDRVMGAREGENALLEMRKAVS